MRIERFEDIKAWQEARALAKMVYEVVKTDKPFSCDFRFRDQIQSATVSIMSNIAEGFSRRSDKEFIQFLFISKASAAEVQSQLYVALDQSYISQKKFTELYAKTDEVAKLISGLISYLLHSKEKPKQLNGSKRLNKPN